MTYVVLESCIRCKLTDCVEVCPVDCIYGYTGDDHGTFPNQLYINPEECIDCGVCEPECPWEAIFEDERVPDVFQGDIALNGRVPESQDNFQVPEIEPKDKPTPEQVVENKTKWNYVE